MEYLIPMWDHQKIVVEKARSKSHFALFMEMGTGKTKTLIEILREIYLEKKVLLRTIILCPPIVVENWRREILANSKIKSDDILCLVGPCKKRLLKLRNEGFYEHDHIDKPKPKIVITNYEGMLMLDLVRAVHAWRPEVLVLDESHKCKSPDAKRSKIIYDLAKSTKYKYLLSGTPITNSPMDLFMQFKILDEGETFGSNYFGFRATYFYDKNATMPKHIYFPNWVLKPDSLDIMCEKIKPVSFRVKKSECLDLPPLVVQNIFVDLAPAQKKMYDDMKADFIAFMNDQACVATLAITKALRLMQITSGFITLEGENGANQNVEIKDNPRAAALKELLEEITPHSKVLVWAVFKENYKTIRHICETLGIDYTEVHGDITPKQKQDNVDRFNSDSKCRVLLGHPGSGGIGVNLTAASYSIFYSRNFSLEQDLQAEARNHRGGSEIHEKITRINLVAKDTIDELIALALQNKIEVSEHVLRDMVNKL